MISRWSHLKTKAISERKRGKSLKDVELSLGIPKSTLSGWFKYIELTNLQKQLLRKRHNQSLSEARKTARNWHKEQKVKRLERAESEAGETLIHIGNNKELQELALAMLYLGEGFKKSGGTGMGNSDPLILKFFIKTLQSVYNLKLENIGIYLHLRADQNIKSMKKYWSKELDIPLDRFRKVSVDKRTVKTKTYSHYKGVCLINCGNVAIQRKLVYIARKFCERVINTHA